MFKKIDSNRSKLYAGFAGVAALALFTACGGDEPAPEEEPADPGIEQEDPAQEDPMGDSPTEGETAPEGDAPAEDPMDGETEEEGAEIEGAGEDSATSLAGLAGNAVSWAL